MKEKIALEIEINGTKKQAANMKELRQSIKDAKNELLQFEAGTDGFAKAQKKVSELTDKMNGIGDSAKIQGTGVERLGQSFGLLTEGITSFDGDKIKTAFTGIGQAMAAIPIFLLIEGIKLLIDNFDEVVKFFREADLSAASFSKTLQDLSEIMKDQLETQQKLLSGIDQNSKIALEKAKQRGASEQELNEIIVKRDQEKNYRLRLNEAALRGQLEALRSTFHKSSEGMEDEDYKNAKENLDKLEKAHMDSLLAIEEQKKSAMLAEESRRTTQLEKARDDAKERKKIREAEEEDRYQEAIKNQDVIDQQYTESLRKEEQQFKDALAQQERLEKQSLDARLAEKKKFQDEEEKLFQEAFKEGERLDDIEAGKSKTKRKDELAKIDKSAKEQEAAILEAKKQGFDAARGLSDAFFSFQLAKAKGNEAEELKIRKRQFEVDKAFSISRAVIDGIRSVQAALTIPPPAGQILAAVNVAVSAANVAKIASTQFTGGPASPPDISTSAAPPPNLSAPTPQLQPTTQLDSNGRQVGQGDNRSYVVYRDIQEKAKTVNKILRQGKF